MNDKGFAITGILYSILILFIAFIALTIFNLQNKKVILDRLKTDTIDQIENVSSGDKIHQIKFYKNNEIFYQENTYLNTFSLETTIANETNISCNNEAIPSYANDTITLNNISKDVTCYINTTLSSAISNLDNTKTNILMVNNETFNSSLNIVAGKNVILDLNGYTITKANSANSAIVNHGSLTIKDETKSGKIVNSATSCARGVYTYGDLSISDIDIEINGTCAAVVVGDSNNPHGNAILNNINIVQNSSGTAVGANSQDNTQLTINNVSIETYSGRCLTITKSGSVLINGGEFISNGIASVVNESAATVTINSGIYTSKNSSAISNSGDGTIRINQTNEPIYISSQSTNSNTTIVNSSTGTVNITGNQANQCTANASDTTSGLCVYSTNHRSVINSGAGTINIDNGSYVSTKATIANNATGIMNINDGYFNSKGSGSAAIYNHADGTMNVTGGLFISQDGSPIYNNAGGTININQTNKPIYASSLATAWKPVIYNKASGTINITATQANACTATASDTTSGLCVYAVGNGNGALQNIADGKIKIDGGTYIGIDTGINNNSTGTMNIINANIISNKWALIENGGGIINVKQTSILANTQYAVTNGKTGTINICGCIINSYDQDLRNVSTGIINYDSSTIFSSGTNTLADNKKYDPNEKISGGYEGTCTEPVE